MDGIYKSIIDLPRRLRHPELWTTRSAGMAFALTISIIAAAFAWRTLPPHSGFIALLARTIAAFLGGGILALTAWWVARDLYRRSGRGHRIAVAYSGDRAPIEDWFEVKDSLAALVEEAGLKNTLNFKLFANDQVNSLQKKEKICRRYDIRGIFLLSAEKVSAPGEGYKYGIKVFSKDELNENEIDYLKAHVGLSSTLAEDVKTEEARIRDRAGNLFQAIAIGSAINLLKDGQKRESVMLFEQVDRRLSTRYGADQPARKHTRKLCCELRISSGSTISDLAAQPDELDQMRATTLEAAELYAAEFPQPAACLSRIELLRGDIESSKNWTERLGDHPDDPFAKMAVPLNSFVLAICEGRWESAREESLKAFRTNIDQARKLDFEELSCFASHLVEINYPHAVVLKGFYETIAGKNSRNFSSTDGYKFLSSDKSRHPLRGTLAAIASELRPPAKIKGKAKRKRGRRRKR